MVTTQLDFTGKPLRSVTTHSCPKLPVALQVIETMAYDHTGRLLSTSQQLPGEAQPVEVARVQYNELGQVLTKTLAPGLPRLTQQVDYAYNIRGWLTSLNNPYAPDPRDLFSMSLHYETGFSKGYEQYNGNLTGQTWRGRGGVQRAYGYVYDPLNRLLQGDYVARQGAPQTSTGAWRRDEDQFRLSFVSYDDNGNIQTLRRRGLLQGLTCLSPAQYGPVDALSYAYAGNRLQAVDDQVTTNQLRRPLGYAGAPTSAAGDFQELAAARSQAQDYQYDASGNLTQDRNKGITGITYNYLNLPRQIQFGPGADSVVFRYTAAGQKTAKLVYQTGKQLAVDDELSRVAPIPNITKKALPSKEQDFPQNMPSLATCRPAITPARALDRLARGLLPLARRLGLFFPNALERLAVLFYVHKLPVFSIPLHVLLRHGI